MQKIRLNHQIYYGPAGWTDLDAAGLLTVTYVTGMRRFRKFIPHYLVIKLFKLPAKTFWRLLECQKIQLEECLDWMKQKNNLTNWLIKMLLIRGRKYYGPNDRLSNLTVEEFMFAEASYTQWMEDKDPATLETLFAALYRTKTIIRGVRRCFTAETKTGCEKAAAKLRPHVKEAIALNYAGCRNNIIAKHPHVWREEVTNPEEQLLTPPMLQKVNWAGLALELSGDKFGTYNQTIKMNLWLFLADMEIKAKRAMQMEAKK